MSLEAGWYHDPSDANQLRYWDGDAWTAHVRPAAHAGSSLVTSEPVIHGVAIVEEFDSGATADVYRGRQEALDRDVAVKLIRGSIDAAALERFKREQVAMGRLSGHPGIVPVYESGVTPNGQPYLVMPFLPGSLAEELRASGAFPPVDAVGVMAQVCDAVHFAHSNGVLHRDIKPANILRSTTRDPMITDFGIAQLGHDDEFAKHDGSMTPLYAAPEVLTGGEASVASDVYALGATLYALLVGAPAFSEGERTLGSIRDRVQHEAVPELPVELPRHVSDAVMRAMAKSPPQRPASASDLADLLRRAPVKPPPPTVAPSPAPNGGPAPSPVREPADDGPTGHRAGWIAAVVAIVVLGGLGAWWLTARGDGDTTASSDDAVAGAPTAETPEQAEQAEQSAQDDAAEPLAPAPTTAPPLQPIDPVKPAFDLLESQARHSRDAYRVGYVGCGIVGVASGTPIGDRFLLTSADVFNAGWLVEARPLEGGDALPATVLGLTGDGLAVLELGSPVPALAATTDVGQGEQLAVVGVISPDSLFTAAEGSVVAVAGATLEVSMLAGAARSSVGAPVFDSEGRLVGTVSGIDGTTAIVSTEATREVVDSSPVCEAISDYSPGNVQLDSNRSVVLSQQLATALADGDWPEVRQLEPGKADYSNQRFQNGWGTLRRSTLIPVRVNDLRSVDEWRFLLVAHERDGGEITKLFCVTWEVDVASGTVDQTGRDSELIDEFAGWVDPATFLDASQREC